MFFEFRVVKRQMEKVINHFIYCSSKKEEEGKLILFLFIFLKSRIVHPSGHLFADCLNC